MLLPISAHDPEPRKVRRVVELLRSGGVVVCPTDTVYAFVCSAEQARAIERVAWLKGTKPHKTELSLICDDLSQAARYTLPINTSDFRMMKKALPGPYTFILPASGEIPKLFKQNRRSVGMRVPDHAVPRAIARELGHALAAASVHDQDRVVDYTTDPERIHEMLATQVDLVLDAGMGGLEASTVIALGDGRATLLRQGKGSVDGLL
jgi:tRNA threonylcarbamoyl adenosine modification protein (Sua5/YciO/YrdC/YwlC family)